jgi:hypothetical protein
MMTRSLKILLGRDDVFAIWSSVAVFLMILTHQLLFFGFLMLVCNINLVFFSVQQTPAVGSFLCSFHALG